MSVKVIKAQNQTVGASDKETAKLRVCAYCRVSTDSDEQETSYEAQVSHYTTYIGAHPFWTLAGIYADRGISGTQAKKRPEFNAMIAACERHEIDQVITKSISRFARNTLDCLNYIRKLKALGIPIIFEKESINTMESSGEILVTILASIAQQESASISANVRMGISYGFQEGRGRVNTSVLLGYTGDGTPGSLVIVPREAEIIRRIYREYLEGYSPYMICERLMTDGITTSTGGRRWYASTVQSILENERYAGDLLMQKYFVEDFLTHKIIKNTGQRPQYFVEDNHAPIVPKAVYYQVQGERQRRSILKCEPGKIRFGNKQVLNGRLICGKCGRTLKRYVKPDESLTDWRCRQRGMRKKSNTKEQPGCRCDCRIVRENDIKTAVLTAFNELPKKREELMTIQEELLTGEIRHINGLIESLSSGQEQIERKLEMLSETIMEDEVFPRTKAIDSASAESVIAKEASEAESLRVQIADIHRQKNSLYTQRAGHVNREMQIRILLELIDQMISAADTGRQCLLEGETVEKTVNADGSCYDYEEFFLRTKYEIPEEVLNESGEMVRFNDDLIIRYLDHILIEDDGCTVRFKAGIGVKVTR